jgi:hypothetical protein
MPIRAGNGVVGHREGQCALVVQRRAQGGRVLTRRGARAAAPRPPCAGDSVSDDPSDDQCGDN